MVALYARADVVRARAATLDPVKVLVFVVGLVPWLVGAVFRLVWLVLSLLIAAGMEGWEAADRRVGAARTDSRGG